MNPEQTKALQTIRNDFLTWEREGKTDTSDLYYGLMVTCAGAVLLVFSMMFNAQKVAFVFGIITILVGLAMLLLSGKGTGNSAEDIHLKLLNYRPINKEAYLGLMKAVAFTGKLRQHDLKHWLNEELAAVEKEGKEENKPA
ncbi:TPA: hypothetical protein ACHF2V_004327 [Citrobacter farmeri]|uniref:hypothetical protein n=1 Tax=Citrobacter TaxID=544 RepID=UPI000E1A5031|nr:MULTISPECIES: hypothetical protein [Citrobacter]EKQ0626982.1 hypothetical protein [Salmonella enterica]MEC3934086.1 hypothetical protein [Citrobacter farmeri]UBI23197.1 hypothetical protein LA348_23905 [Citrobacter amalonaticus]STA62743.1 Uncharacterised protein [Citrobacter amalonaticus]BCU51138.1 hypothetical protein CIAM_46590 [Citrobacter amalonaticus]